MTEDMTISERLDEMIRIAKEMVAETEALNKALEYE